MKWHQRFFWLLLLFLPTQLGYHFWPDWAGVLGRRVDYLAPTVYLTDILILLTLSSWFVSQKSKIQIKNTIWKLLSPLGIAAIFITANTLAATSPLVALYKWIKVMEFVLLGWYIVKTKPRFAVIVTPLSIGVFYSSILAITQFVLQHSVGGPLWWLGERTFDVGTPGIARIPLRLEFGIWNLEFGLKMRPYATFPHPNVLGGFLAAVLPLVVVRYLGNLRNLRKKMKLFYGSVLAVGVFALLFTFSRSAIAVGMIAITAVIANFKFQISNFKLFLIFFFVIIFGFLLITHHPSPINPNEESVVVRQQLNAAAIKLWQSSPLFGVGLGNFLVRLPEALPTRTIYFLQPVHNIYLLLLSEVGIVGIGLIVFFIVTLLNHESGIMKYGKDKTKFIIPDS